MENGRQDARQDARQDGARDAEGYMTLVGMDAHSDKVSLSARKLAAYVGLNPSVADSGKTEKKRRVSRYGRRDLKSLMIEAAQSAMGKGRGDMHRWARRKIAAGKEHNVVACALARKMLCHLWHVLMGHPSPAAEPEASFRNKLSRLAGRVGKEKMKELGHESAAKFAESIIAAVRWRGGAAMIAQGTS